MSIRFRRSKSLGGLGKVNLTKGGLGLSFGGKGARIGVGPRGAYTSGGIPGTGLYAINYGKKGKTNTNVAGQTDDASSQQTNEIPIPAEIKTSYASVPIFIVSIIAIFIQPVIGFLGVIGAIVLFIYGYSSPKGKAQSYFLQGKKHYKTGNYQEALNAFNYIFHFVPSVPSLYPLMAEMHMDFQEYEKAAELYKKYSEYDPLEPIVIFNYGLALSLNQNYDEAISVFQSLPDGLKEEVRVIVALGDAFLKSGRPEAAVLALEAGPTKKRKMDDMMKLFRYKLGIAYKEVGEKKKAIKQLQKVLAEDVNYEDTEKLLNELQV